MLIQIFLAGAFHANDNETRGKNNSQHATISMESNADATNDTCSDSRNDSISIVSTEALTKAAAY
jgi:hypothetical protein